MAGPTSPRTLSLWQIGLTLTLRVKKGTEMLRSFVRRRDVHLWSFMFAVLAGVPVMSSDDPKPNLNPISVTIHLPADADLEIQGKKVEGSGELRHETVIPTKNEPE